MTENTPSTPEPQDQPQQTTQPGEPAPYAGSGYQQGGSPQGGYEQSGYQQQSHQAGGYSEPGAQQAGYQQAGYAQAGYQQGDSQQGGYQQGYTGGPNQLSPTDERTWSIAAHLSPFLASFVGLPFLGPLVIYLVFRDRGPFVRHHAAQALNFQIIVAIGLLISIPLMFVLIGFVTAAIIGIAAIVFQIVAAVEANNGKWYRYPMTPDWVK